MRGRNPNPEAGVSGDQKALNVSLKSRRFKVGIYSMVISLLVLAIAVIVNISAARLPGSLTKLDTSFNDMFTVTDQTRDIVSGLQEDVTVYLIVTAGNEDTAISEMLSRYESLSPHVKVVHRDPTLYPNFVSEYTDEVLYNNSLIVVGGKRSRAIDYHSIYTTEYTYSYLYNDYYSQTYFAGEDVLTSAIDFVTTDNLPVAYTLTGHGERALTEAFTAAAEKANLRLEEISLIASPVMPRDMGCLIINGPTADLGSEETAAILDYMQNGGRVLLTTSYAVSRMPNFLRLLETYGLEPVDGYVVETDNNNYVNFGSYLLPTIGTHEITQTLIDNRYHVLLPGAQGIRPIDVYRSTLNIETLLSTSDSSFSKLDVDSDTLTKQPGDTDGPFIVGAAVSEQYLSDVTKLVWYSTGYMVDDKINSLVGGGNSTLFVNSLTWLCDLENAYTIPSHSLGVSALQTPTVWVYILAGVFIAAIPGAVIAVGAVRLYRRKKR